MHRSGRKSDGGKPETHIDLGIGGLLKGIGSLIDLVSDMSESGKEKVERTGETDIPGGGKAMYGISVKIGLGGAPVIEKFGNVRETEHGAVIEETREPYTDVFDEGATLHILVELPGVESQDIKVEVRGDVLSLHAESAKRKYAKELLLPAKVDDTSLTSSYSNGILEIRMRKRGGEKRP
ncbi:MAG: archaeal heat shock protein Hsp20 [Bacillota bacterium]|nr:archaeal heat shock protein Hsp20 [Bacillota bacterium]